MLDRCLSEQNLNEVYRIDDEIYKLQGNLKDIEDTIKLQKLYRQRISIITISCSVIQD